MGHAPVDSIHEYLDNTNQTQESLKIFKKKKKDTKLGGVRVDLGGLRGRSGK